MYGLNLLKVLTHINKKYCIYSIGPLPLSCYTKREKVLSLFMPAGFPAPPSFNKYSTMSKHPPDKARVLLRPFLIRRRRPRALRICFFQFGWDMGHFADFTKKLKETVKLMTLNILLLRICRRLLSVVSRVAVLQRQVVFGVNPDEWMIRCNVENKGGAGNG